ncbi:hypothetical protein ACWGNM_16380 [Streptomyces sp. NPDC055796]
MTENKALKRAIRKRMAETNEPFSTARRNVLAFRQKAVSPSVGHLAALGYKPLGSIDVAKLMGPRVDVAKLMGPRVDVAKLMGPRVDVAKLMGPRIDVAKLMGPRIDVAKLMGPRIDVAKLMGIAVKPSRRP